MTAIGAKARLEQENTRLQLERDTLAGQVTYLLRYIVDLQQDHGDDFPFPELEPRFTEGQWWAVL